MTNIVRAHKSIVCKSIGVGVMTNYLIRTIDATDLNVLIIYEAERGCHRINMNSFIFAVNTRHIFFLVANIQFYVSVRFFLSTFRSKHSPLPLYFSAYVWWSRHVPKKNAIQIAHSVGSEHWHPNERRDVKRCKMWIDNKRLGATSRIKPRHVIKLPLLHLAGPFKRISHSGEWKNPYRPMFHVCACAPPTSANSNIVCDTFNFNVLFRSFNRNSTEIFRMNWKTFSSLQANENIEKKRNAGEEKMRNEKNKSGYYLHFQADMRKKKVIWTGLYLKMNISIPFSVDSLTHTRRNEIIIII